MTTELNTQLIAALQIAAPEIGKEYLYERCVSKYLAAMLPAISAAIALNHKRDDLRAGDFAFSQSKIREEIGTIGKQQRYIYEVMKSNPATSLLMVIRKGFSKNGVSKLSRCKINPLYEDLVMDELLNLRIEANQQLLDEIEQTAIPESLVKTIFTAMGFGAELKNNQHNAIRGALAAAARCQHDPSIRLDRDIYNGLGADEFKRLTANRTFAYLYEELQAVNQTLLAHFDDEWFAIGEQTYRHVDPKTGKKRSHKQKLAWIYQALESMAMQQFVELAQQEPLLTTHDCVYFKQKLPASIVVDATCQLQQTFPFLRFEHEVIYPIAEDEHHAAPFAAAQRNEAAHKQRIADEEQRAAASYGASCSSWVVRANPSHSSFATAL